MPIEDVKTVICIKFRGEKKKVWVRQLEHTTSSFLFRVCVCVYHQLHTNSTRFQYVTINTCKLWELSFQDVNRRCEDSDLHQISRIVCVWISTVVTLWGLVNFDNSASRMRIKNVLTEICTKFQDEIKALWVRGYVVSCRKVHEKIWIWHLNLCPYWVKVRSHSQTKHSCWKVPKHDSNPLEGVYRDQTGC